jgi:hypothetical protein
MANPPGSITTQSYVVSVDPEFIPNRRCRDWFWKLPTSWDLPKATVSALIALGETLVLNGPGMKDYLMAENIPVPSSPNFSAACKPAWNG